MKWFKVTVYFWSKSYTKDVDKDDWNETWNICAEDSRAAKARLHEVVNPRILGEIEHIDVKHDGVLLLRATGEHA